jgi:hypothetical protein
MCDHEWKKIDKNYATCPKCRTVCDVKSGRTFATPEEALSVGLDKAAQAKMLVFTLFLAGFALGLSLVMSLWW